MANRHVAALRAHKATARRAWLQACPQFTRLPSEKEDVDDEQSGLLTELAKAMVSAGLYARSTERADIRWGIRVLVGEIRRCSPEGER